MPKRKRCQFCSELGHNQRACPKLALKLLRKVQDRHSIESVATAMRDKSRQLAVQGIDVRYGSRKAVKKAASRAMRQVHRGTRAVSSARRKRVTSKRQKQWAEQRRTAKRRTKCETKTEEAKQRIRVSRAWTQLKELGWVKRNQRGSMKQFACPVCPEACVCKPALRLRDRDTKDLSRALEKNKCSAAHVWFQGSRCCRPYSCLRFTWLPEVRCRWPLPHVVAFLTAFCEMEKPHLQSICQRVGVSRCSTSRKLFRFLLEREALTGYHAMKSMKLRGVVEADGTALRLCKRGGHNHFVALWGLVERPKSASMPRLLVYMVPVKKVSPNSVCPVECREDVLNTEGLKSILPCQRGGRKVESLLISGGAKLYGKLAAEHGMRHQFVVHSRGEWSREHNSRAHGRLQINTGLIDQRWSNIKAFLPKSLTAGSKQGLADGEPLFKCDLWLYLYSYWLRSHFPDVQTRTRMIVKDLERGFT